MEHTVWTNERLDDLAEGMRTGFARNDQDIRDLRTETRSEIAELRREVREGFSEMRGEMAAMRLVLLRLGGGILVGLLGVIAAVLARGV